jgi:hypothetical protein
MANHVKNDRGEWVIAEGAPGSIVRARCEWPDLIDRINGIHATNCNLRGDWVPGGDRDKAIEAIRDVGIKDPTETNNILRASDYGRVG